MKYSVCVIDDKIPASSMEGIRDTDLLNATNLQLLLQQEALWTDEVIRNLIRTLLEQKDADNVTSKWDVYGFTNPSFFLNTLDNGLPRFDIVVFDWEYPGTGAGAGQDPETILKEVLEKTFCLLFIFSGADKEQEIQSILDKQEFQDYKERLQYLNKSVGGADQTDVLLQRAEEMYSNNFSFRFADILRKRTLQSVDKILSEMGRASLNDVKNHIAGGDGGKKDFVDFLAERFRTTIAGNDLYELIEQIPEPASETSVPDESLAAGVWSYRLYFHRETGDDLVRRGDIVSNDGTFYLVLSADCDLLRFWKKNLGIINAVNLHELDNQNTNLKDLLTLCVAPNQLSQRTLTNLLDRIGDLADGPFVLPFVPIGDAKRNFVAIPKDIASQRISVPPSLASHPKKQLANEPMKYSYWSGAQRICTVSEPFLTPVIQHVFNVMGGYGVPDYPDHMKDILKRILGDFGAASATPATAPTTPSTTAPEAPATPSETPATAPAATLPAIPLETPVQPKETPKARR